jgi:hypothetical protein
MRNSARHFVSNALCGCLVSNRAIEGAYAILLPMACQIRLMAVPSRGRQTDSRDMRSLTHPHRGINSLSSRELTNG